MKKIHGVFILPAIFAAGYLAGSSGGGELISEASAMSSAESAPAQNLVYELRTYTAPEGKLGNLHARFRDHTMRLFERHGMTNIGYWVPQDPELSQNTLIYLLAHPSREAARESWSAFSADPEWRQVSAESQVDGRIVERVESIFMDPTDYSQMR